MRNEAETVQLDDQELRWIEAAIKDGALPEEDELDMTLHVVK
jgi:hypothetical protein